MLVDLFAKNVAVTSVPSELFDHEKQRPSHADVSLTEIWGLVGQLTDYRPERFLISRAGSGSVVGHIWMR